MTSGVATTSLNFVVTAVSYPIFLHFLGYERYGLWLVLTAVIASAQMGNLGMNAAVSRFVAYHYGRRDFDRLERDVITAMATLLASGLLIVAVILVLREQVVGLFRLTPDDAALVRALLPAVCLLSLYVFIVRAFAATLSGLGRMDLVNYGRIGGRVVSVGLSALLLWRGVGVAALLVGYVVAEVLSHVFYIAMVSRLTRIRYWLFTRVNGESFRRLIGYGMGVLGSMAFEMALGPFNKMMLSRYAGVDAVAVYDIAYTASMYFRGVVTSAFQAMVPEVSRLSGLADQGRDRVRELFRRSARLNVLLGTPLFVIVWLMATLLLSLWLRKDLDPRLTGAFRVGLASAYLSLLGVTPYYFLLGLGQSRSVCLASALLTGADAIVLIGWVGTGHLLTPLGGVMAVLTGTALGTAFLFWKWRHGAPPAALRVRALASPGEEQG